MYNSLFFKKARKTIKFMSNLNKVREVKANTKKQDNDATCYMQLDEPMFAGVKTDEGIIIVCGKYRVSMKTFKTFENANDYVNSKPYEIIINTAVLITKLQNDEKDIKTIKQENEPNK